jgi:hypothetical protein
MEGPSLGACGKGVSGGLLRGAEDLGRTLLTSSFMVYLLFLTFPDVPPIKFVAFKNWYFLPAWSAAPLGCWLVLP